MSEESYCDVAERLFGEFERVHRLPVIAAVVRQCQVQLEGAAKGSVPVLLERLARQRLTDLPPTLPGGTASVHGAAAHEAGTRSATGLRDHD